MTPAEYSKFLLALVIYREARGEGEVGMIAVAHVIANRCFTWGKSYHDVILGQNQFSSMSVPNDPELHVWPALGDPVFDIAEAAYSGFSKDPTGGALYYANERVVTSGWYEREIIQSGQHPAVVVLGKHTFRL